MTMLLEERLASATSEGIRGNLGRWFRFVGTRAGEWTELQTLGFRTSHGERTRVAHAANLEHAVRLLEEADRYVATGHYVIANHVNEAVATRRECNRWHDAQKGASTTDRDIVARRVLFIDVDARRPSGTSATDAEMEAAVQVAEAIYARLSTHFGSAALGYGHSGNGRQVFVALEPIEETEASVLVVRALLAALGCRYAAEGAAIDASVYDAKRLVPAFGTTKRKGAPNVPSRPHRRTAFVCEDAIARVPFASVAELVTQLREELDADGRAEIDRLLGVGSERPRSGSGPFAQANAVAIDDLAGRLGLKNGEKVTCPGCGSTDGVALVGGGLKCLHQRCAQKGAPRNPGFRTPVDLVMEARRVDARGAVAFLAREYGLDVAPPRPALRLVSPDDKSCSTRRSILIRPRENDVADEAIAALVEERAEVFQRAGELVRIIEDEARPVIARVTLPTLRELLAATADWVEVKENRKGEPVERVTHPPRWAVEAVHARGEWLDVRPLRAVVSYPVLRADGTIVDTTGYDAATRVLYVPNADFGLVPAEPAREDVEAAVAVLRDVVADFPFKGEEHFSAWVAALLTPLVRFTFVGAVPSVVIDGNAPGAGKSLLANVLGTLVTGRELDIRSELGEDDESRKRIIAMARSGDPYLLVDNVTKPLGGGALDAALTARGSWTDRSLGTLDELRTVMVSQWVFTGNNVEFRRRDTRRRCLHVRLEAPDEQPENREGFRHTPLLAWVKEHRVRLLRAALTMLRGYAAAGMPELPLSSWGSYEEWSRIVRQCVVWCGLTDPYESRRGLEQGDPESASLEALFGGWAEIVKDLGARKGGCSAAEVVEALRDDDLARLTPSMQRHRTTYPLLREAFASLLNTPPGQVPTAYRLGSLLRRFRGRTVSGLRLEGRVYQGTTLWSVATAAPR